MKKKNIIVLTIIIISILVAISIMVLKNEIEQSKKVVLNINSIKLEFNKNEKTDLINLETFNSEKDVIIK